jgi:hypothetical protein
MTITIELQQMRAKGDFSTIHKDIASKQRRPAKETLNFKLTRGHATPCVAAWVINCQSDTACTYSVGPKPHFT